MVFFSFFTLGVFVNLQIFLCIAIVFFLYQNAFLLHICYSLFISTQHVRGGFLPECDKIFEVWSLLICRFVDESGTLP